MALIHSFLKSLPDLFKPMENSYSPLQLVLSWQWFLHEAIKILVLHLIQRLILLSCKLQRQIGSDHILIFHVHFHPITFFILHHRLSPPCFRPLLSRVIWDQREQDFHIRQMNIFITEAEARMFRELERIITQSKQSWGNREALSNNNLSRPPTLHYVYT